MPSRCRLVLLAATGVYVAFLPLAQAQWNVEAFGSGSLTKPFDVKVGKARNDGLNRVYVSERNGDITEWSRTGSDWSSTQVYSGVINLASLAIGDARGDGTNRLYFSEFKQTGALYEAEWTGSDWDVSKVDDTYQSLCIFIGEGRNDGSQHVYVGTFGNSSAVGRGLWEYTYGSGGWTKIQLHANGMEGNATVADIHNDGTNRVIANTSVLDEYTWNGSGYTSSAIDSSASLWPDPVDAGTTRNDDLTRIVVNSGHGKVEYMYSDGTWDKTVFDPTVQRGDILVARLRADGQYRIYATHTSRSWGTPIPKGPIKEYSWNGETYSNGIVVDGITGATAKLDAGNGRNDRVARLYTPDYEGGRILEITSIEPLVYASPADNLVIAGVEHTAGHAVLLLSNLTERCEYRIQSAPDLTGTWSNAASFTAYSPLATWSNTLESTREFYKAIGFPQEEP